MSSASLSSCLPNALFSLYESQTPKKNVTLERFKFFTRRQEFNETLDSFVTALNNLSLSCELGDLRDVLVKDIMICGIADSCNVLRDRLIQEDPVSLDDAIKKAKQYTEVCEQSKRSNDSLEENKLWDPAYWLSLEVKEETEDDVKSMRAETPKPDKKKPTREKSRSTNLRVRKESKKSEPVTNSPKQNELEEDSRNSQLARYVCKICGKALKKMNSLNRHMLIHSGERPFMCAKCGKCFIRKGALDAHVSTHNKERPFVCDYCNKSFVNKLYLFLHIRIHTGEKPYQCQFCGKTFIQKSSLNGHVRMHTKERPYSCKDCPANFTYKSDLNSHILAHTGETPYVCQECGKSFLRKTYLSIHQRTHSEDRPFECSVCGKGFKCKKHLSRHAVMHCDKTRPISDTCFNL